MLFDLERSYFSSSIILRLFPYIRVTDLESSLHEYPVNFGAWQRVKSLSLSVYFPFRRCATWIKVQNISQVECIRVYVCARGGVLSEISEKTRDKGIKVTPL